MSLWGRNISRVVTLFLLWAMVSCTVTKLHH